MFVSTKHALKEAARLHPLRERQREWYYMSPINKFIEDEELARMQYDDANQGPDNSLWCHEYTKSV